MFGDVDNYASYKSLVARRLRPFAFAADTKPRTGFNASRDF